MKATLRFIIELETEVEIETTLKSGLYEFDDYEEEEHIKDELERIEDIVLETINIPENEQCSYVKQSLSLTTLYVTTDT
jgi:hypothetical protein